MSRTLRQLLPAVTLIGLLLGSHGRAAEITVTTLSDELDLPSGANMSLREAVRDAVAGDTIRFAPELDGGTISLTRGTLPIGKTLTVDAMQLPAGLTLDGTSLYRVLSTATAGSSNVTLRGLHITRGRNGIQNTGNLTMEDCTVSACVSSTPGAGITQTSGALILRQCSILSNRGETGIVSGGGVAISAGTSKFINCTIAENDAVATTSGISSGFGATLELIHSTVANNRTTSLTGAAVTTGAGTLRLQNSVIAGNLANSSTRIDLAVGSATLQKSGQNFLSSNSGVTTQFPASTLVGTAAAPLDPMFAALAPNGGRTKCYLPLSGSKLLHAAVATADSPAIDQRGLPRVAGSSADLGSVEASSSVFFPADGETGVSFAPMLEWSHQVTASLYQVYLGSDPGNLTLQGSSPTGRLTLSSLAPGETYYWRIDSIVSGSTIPGPLLSFVVRPPFVVTKASDEGSAAAVSEAGVSLREAILLANARPGFDVIRFHPDLAGSTLQVRYGIFDITSDLLIEGDSLPGGASVSGAGLRIQAPTELRSLALMNGAGVSTSGGTVHVTSNLTARNCTIAGNRAGNGGGIYLQSGACTLIHCTITGNTANFRGGGIYRSGGTLVLENSIIAGNRALEESPDVRVTASLTSLGRNLIGNNGGSEAMFPVSSWVGSAGAPLNAGLAPAGNHVAGKSHHCPPVPGSAALAQAIPLSTTPSVDQLGRPRPINGTAALGAVERDPALILFLPTAGEVQVVLAPLLAWNTPGQTYEVFIGTSPDNLTSAGTTSRGSFQLPSLASGATYYWRVDTTTAGVTTSGSISSFTTRSPIVVTTTDDENDSDPQAGGDVSLREALAIAATRPGPDRIVFAAALSGSKMALSQSGLGLTISSECEIDAGDLPGGITLDLAGDRQLRIAIAGETIIRRVRFTGALRIGSGSAVICNGSALLSRVVFHGNSGTSGGALNNDGGRLLVENSIFTGNTGSQGGALYCSSGATRVTNCTFTGNRAVSGGAIFSSGSSEFKHCTITSNLAKMGGGLYVSANGAVLANSIVANNAATDTRGEVDIFPASISYLTTQGTNLVGVNYGLETLFPTGPLAGTRQSPLDPKLLLLANASNPGAITAPGSDSPAINRGAALSSPPATDQRGQPRVSGAFPDLGAIEVSAGDAFFYPANASTGVQPSETLRWHFESGADSYRILLGAAGGPLAEIGSTSSSSFPVSLASGSSFEWQVIAVRDETLIPSPVMSFTVRPRFVVTTLVDEDDANPHDGSGLSLRECLRLAAANPGRDQISLSSSLPVGSLFLSKGVLVLDSDVDVDGTLSGGRLVIDGNHQTRLLWCDIWHLSPFLSNLVLQRGYSLGIGGGIYNSGRLSLARTELRDCRSDYSGGGITNDEGVMELESCSILANRAARTGHAIYSRGTFRARNSTVALSRSTLPESDAGSSTQGAAIWADELDLINCTVAFNRGKHAAIEVAYRGDLTHTTVSCNQATSSAAGILWDYELTLRNCIVAGNHTGSLHGVSGGSSGITTHTWRNDDLSGPDDHLVLEGKNLIGNNYELAAVLPPGPLVGTPASPLSPGLLDLGNYGGMTLTMPPGGDSPARRASTSLAYAPISDQRGVPRGIGIAPDLGATDQSTQQAALFPTAGETGLPTKPRLSWIFETSATQYEVFLGTSPSTMTSLGTVTSPGITPSALSPLTTYHWKVVASVSGSPVESPVQSFTTRDLIRVTSAEDNLSVENPALPALRQALVKAELDPGYDEITLGVELPAEGITLAGIPLELSGELAIRSDNRLLPIKANSLSRVLFVWPGSSCLLENVAIQDGRSEGGAGMYLSRSSVTLRDCEVRANFTMSGVAWGGGLYLSGGEFIAESCLFHGNQAAGHGGGLYAGGTNVILRNCTFSGNSAAIGGALQGSSSVELDHCTITNNQASGQGGGTDLSAWSHVRIANCLIAGNRVVGSTLTAPGHDFYHNNSNNSHYLRQGVNFVGNNNACSTLFPAGPKVGTTAAPLNPLLAPLGRYGGLSRCHIPLPGSPVVDAAAVLATTPGLDQRGLPRPIGVAPDIGAVESFPVTTPIVDSDHDGMDDRLEVMWGFSVGSKEGAADTDGDGASNAEELESCTNPFDPAERLKILTSQLTSSSGPGQTPVMNVTWASFPGMHYTLQISDNLNFSGENVRTIAVGPATGFSQSQEVPLQSGRDFVRVRTN